MQAPAIVEILLNLVGNTSVYILYLLIILSVWATAIIVERLLYYRATLPDIQENVAAAREQIIKGVDADWTPPELGAVGSLLQDIWQKANTMHTAQAMLKDASGRLRRDLMRRANVLGTLGANTPFIGLLGTVFGIIEAFRQLSETTGKGADAVMGGIAEALVATGMGLLVAIPCVLFYNGFSRRAQQIAEQIEEVGTLVAAEKDAARDKS